MGLIDTLQLDDLDDEQRQMADLIGLENYIKMVSIYGGNRLYIPKPEGVGKAYRNQLIREQFNGYNFRELASKYKLSEVTIRYIVADIVKPKRCQPAENQLTFLNLK